MKRNLLNGPAAIVLACLAVVFAQATAWAHNEHIVADTEWSQHMSVADAQHLHEGAVENAEHAAQASWHSGTAADMDATASHDDHLSIESPTVLAHLHQHEPAAGDSLETAHHTLQVRLVEQHQQIA